MNIDTNEKLQLGAFHFFGESVAVLGIKGSGKTNTSAVIIEELLAARVPMTIVDIENEYYGLKEKFDLLIVGRSENADMDVSVSGAAALAAFSIQQSVSVILELSDHDEDEAQEFLLAYFEALFAAASKNPKPYQVILEEAHEFVPQGIRTPLKKVLTRIALRGRKRGLGTMMISQRSAKVEKDLLTQAGIVFLHTVVHPADMGVYQDILGMTKTEVQTRVAQLERGKALVKNYGTVETVQIRLRDTFHAGTTPGMDAVAAPALRKIDAALLEELKKATEKAVPARGQNQVDVLLRQLDEKQVVIQTHEETIRQLQAQIEIYRKLEVQMSQPLVMAAAPQAMQVEKIHTGQIVTNGASAVAQPVLPAPATTTPKPVPAPAKPHVSPLAERRAWSNQKRRFDGLLNELRELRLRAPIKLFTLQYLISHSDKEFSTHDLAASMGYSSSTLVRNPPLDFMQKGLIARTGSGNHNYKYSAKGIRATLAKEYPALDVDEMVKQILRIE